MTGLTQKESEAIELLSISELLKLHEDTIDAIIVIYERIMKCCKLLEEGGESFRAIVNLPAIFASIKRLEDEATRLRVISVAARQEAIKRASESN